MDTDGPARRPAPGEPDLTDLAGLAWLAAVRRGDRGTFDMTVRHTQERLAGHLLGTLRLPPEQSMELTEQTVLDALETAGQSTAIESPLARLFGTARARLRDRLQAAFGDNAGMDLPFAPEPDSAMLRAFYAGDPRLDRQLAQRRDLLPFLELTHEIVQSLPDDQRAAVDAAWTHENGTRYPAGLLAMAGAVLLAHTRLGYCAVFDEHLSQAGWQPGEPFSHPLGLGLLYHVAACPECRPSQQQAEQRIAALPPLVLWVSLRLAEQRRSITAAVLTDDPAPVEAAAHDADRTAALPLAPPAGDDHAGRGRRRRGEPKSRTRSGRRAAGPAAAVAAGIPAVVGPGVPAGPDRLGTPPAGPAPGGGGGPDRGGPGRPAEAGNGGRGPGGPGRPAGTGGVAGPGPVGAGGPGGPDHPGGSGGSAGPGHPGGPGGSAGPAGPGRPGGPGGSAGPAGPGRPGGPGGSAGPAGPAGPGSPGGPRRAAASGGRGGLGELAKRRMVAVAIVLGLLAISLVSWRLSGGPPDGAVPLVLDTPAGTPLATDPSGIGPSAGTGTATGTTPAGSTSPAATTSPATSSAAPTTASSPADPTGSATGSPTGSPTGTAPGSGGTPTPGAPAGRLIVKMAPLSTGAVTVTIAGNQAGNCSGSAAACTFAVQPGQQVSLDSKDVVLSWGGSPCTTPRSAGNCSFTAAAENTADPLVLRLAL